jgi:hypothetical protein
MEMNQMKFSMCILALLTGCSAVRETPSVIVQKAQLCGSGELARTSAMAMQDWFGRHRACAVAVEGMCKPIRAKAAAAWTDSTEGRVCTAARNTAQWVRKPSSDHEAFRAAWK